MCDVLDKVENRGIAKGKAEGEDSHTRVSAEARLRPPAPIQRGQVLHRTSPPAPNNPPVQTEKPSY